MKKIFFKKSAAAIFALLTCSGQRLFSSAPFDRQTAPSSAATPAADSWMKDIDALTSELPKRHKNLFARISEAEFRGAAANLKASFPSLNQDEILVGVLKLIASIGDSHTVLGYRPARLFPLMIFWFDDGLWIRNTVDEHRGILNGRITAVDGRAVEDVVAALAILIMTYSTKHFQEVEGDPASLEPEIRPAVNFADHRADRDPVLEAVLAFGR